MLAVGIALPTNRLRLTGDDLGQAAASLAEAGCESLWVNDHLALFPVGSETYPYSASGSIDWDPYAPQYEPLTVCAFLAAVTQRVTIGTSVMILPQRHPIEVAKMAATLADLSGGRFVLGVGAGWSRREMALLGWDPANRGARMDEQIDIIRNSFFGGYSKTAHYDIPADVILEPKPLAGQAPPILIGGNSPAALDRVRLRGDGWLAVTPGEKDRLLALGVTLADTRRRTDRPLRAVLKVILDHPDPQWAAQVVDWVGKDGWDEVTFEFKRWELDNACRLVEAALE